MFPGSFDPLTIAHLGVADAARAQLDLDRIDLAISEQALTKPSPHDTRNQRLADIEAVARDRPWLRAVGTADQLIADIAEEYDACILGADKWAQVLDVAFYRDRDDQRRALDRLPLVAVAPRAGTEVPTAPPGVQVVVLHVSDELAEVSSTAVRGGRERWRARPAERS